jgi:hypothetical protein
MDAIQKFNNKKSKTMNKFPKGQINYTVKGVKYKLQFDKNGQLCDLQPRIGDVFNTYKGRTRLFIPEIIDIIKGYAKNNN